LKYSIITIDDRRKAYKDKLIEKMGQEPEGLPSIDGRTINWVEMTDGLNIPRQEWTPTQGEGGVWLSNFLHWDAISKYDEPVIIFEDDAIVMDTFYDNIDIMMEQLPEDWDYFALWVPDNQRQDYMYNVTYDIHGLPQIRGYVRYEGESCFNIGANHIAKVYQGYGLVATMYSPRGAQKLVDLARRHGIYTPVDCFIHDRAHAKELEGFAPKPHYLSLITYDWPETTVHNTERMVL